MVEIVFQEFSQWFAALDFVLSASHPHHTQIAPAPHPNRTQTTPARGYLLFEA
ncbi:hypothetical protein ACRS5S_16665 [Nocardia asiatica]|uniref:hypothetical protein n=1 Tax=Nocardia asiatica TaxID=209252 RepID=UPI003EDFEAAA